MRYGFLIFFLLTACVGSRKFTNVNFEKEILTFDKVRLKIESEKNENVTLRGYISLIKDSLICFSLWGPLGYKVMGGEFSDKFKITDYYHQTENPDILKELINQSGIIFNRKCLENLILGHLDKVKEHLAELNNNVITFEKKRKNQKEVLTIYNNPRNSNLQFEVMQRRNQIRQILIVYNSTIQAWKVQIEIISASNSEKC